MMRRIRRLFADRAGNSAIEIALLAPLLSFALLAAADLSRGFSQRLRLVSAADRTVSLASAPGAVRADYSFLKAEAEAAAGVDGAKAVVSNWLECDGVKQQAGTNLCAGNQGFSRYVEVAITASYDPLFNFGGLLPWDQMTIAGSAAVRIQ